MERKGTPADPVPLNRRRFMQAGAAAVAAMGISGPRAGAASLAATGNNGPAADARAAGEGRPANVTSRLILLGTAGGPTPRPNRAAPAQAIVVGDACYVIDCGNGVARQMVLAKLRLGSIRGVFLTHHHSDHNADYGTLLLLSWG